MDTKINSFILILSCLGLLEKVQSIDCNGKAFICTDNMHFSVCVETAPGKTETLDDSTQECPSNTICNNTAEFECSQFVEVTTKVPTTTTHFSIITTQPPSTSNNDPIPFTNSSSTTTNTPTPFTNSPSTTTNTPTPFTNSPSTTTNTPTPFTNSPSTTTNTPTPFTNSPSTITNFPSTTIRTSTTPNPPMTTTKPPTTTNNPTTITNAPPTTTNPPSTTKLPTTSSTLKPPTTTGPPPTTTNPPSTTTQRSITTKAPLTTKLPPTTSKPNGCPRAGTFGDPNSCHIFYRCVGVQRFQYNCPFTSVYSSSLRLCTRNKSLCENSNPPTCTTRGRLTDPKSCYSYFLCQVSGSGFVVARYHCPETTSYDAASKQCILGIGSCRGKLFMDYSSDEAINFDNEYEER